MRFSLLHKFATYLMMASAFAALALSQELGWLTIALSAIAMTSSWFWEAPRVRPERWIHLWNAVAVAGLLGTSLMIFYGGNVVVEFARFLIVLSCAKLFSRRAARDYHWSYVLAFSLLTAATALNGDLSFAVCFVVFAVSTTWALILSHLRDEMEENLLLKHVGAATSEKIEVERILGSRRIVGWSFLFWTSALSMAMFVATLLLFFLVPRVGIGLLYRGARGGMTLAGFSDDVKLGGHGIIRDDPTVIMRAFISNPSYKGSDAPPLHWRGVAFDRYFGGEWSRSASAPKTHHLVESHGRSTRLILLPQGGDDSMANLARRIELSLTQEIYLEPVDSTVLFAAARPLAFEIDGTGQQGRGQVGQNDEIRHSHPAGLHYLAFSEPATPDLERLRRAEDADPRRFKPYLQIPAEVPSRVRELAVRVTKNAHGPYEKAMAIQSHLRKEYGYTLEQATDPSYEPLDYFLFERKKGHCEYFSSAMAILLRAASVPTRNVNGFLGGEWNEYGGYVAVRAGDAHSWIEVWIDGVGWVTFDPTPPGQRLSLQQGPLDRLRRFLDTARLRWFQWVIDYDLGRQVGMFRKAARAFETKRWTPKRVDPRPWLKRHAVELSAGTVALLAVLMWRSRTRRNRTAVSDFAVRKARGPIGVAYASAEAKMARLGHARDAAKTPREHADRLVEQRVPGALPFSTLTDVYYAARFGDAMTAEAESRAKELAKEIREAHRAR